MFTTFRMKYCGFELVFVTSRATYGGIHGIGLFGKRNGDSREDAPNGRIEVLVVGDPVRRLPDNANVSFEVLYEVIHVKYICKFPARWRCICLSVIKYFSIQ